MTLRFDNPGSQITVGSLFLGPTELTGLPNAPSGDSAATSKLYVDGLVASGITWRKPIQEPDLAGIAISVPGAPVTDTSYIAYGGVGYPQTWVNLISSVNSGDVLTWNGTMWIFLFNLFASPPSNSFWRLGVCMEHGVPDTTLTNPPLSFRKNDLIQWVPTSIDPTLSASWTFPEGRANDGGGGPYIAQGVTVLVDNSNSLHFGHTYLYSNAGNTWTEINAGGSTTKLSAIVAADAANMINSANWQQQWRWALTADGTRGFLISESAASAGGAGDQQLFQVETQASSTANPFVVRSGGISIFPPFGPINNILVDNTGGITFRSNDSSGTPTGVSIFGGNSSGTQGGSISITGGDATGLAATGGGIEFIAGQGTTGGWGSIIFGSSGNTVAGVFYPKSPNGGNFVWGSPGSTIATNSTDGFLYIQGMSGIPTGIPTTYLSDKVPLTYNTAANLMYAYSSGAWRIVGGSVALNNITAATASNTINNGDNAQVWNWDLTTASKVALTISENVASTGAGSTLLLIQTQGGSTAAPFQVITGNSTDFNINVNASGALTLKSAPGENILMLAEPSGGFPGSIQITGGTGIFGGSIGITGGTATGAGSGAGDVLISGGNNTTVGTAGATVDIEGGDSTDPGSVVTITAGAHTSYRSGDFSGFADAQSNEYLARTQTTTAALTELFLDGTGGIRRMTLAIGSAWRFEIHLVAYETAGANAGWTAAYEIKGAIKNVGGTVSIVGSVSSNVTADDSSGVWTVTTDADNTNKSLRIQVTGQAATTIRWLAYVRTVEVKG